MRVNERFVEPVRDWAGDSVLRKGALLVAGLIVLELFAFACAQVLVGGGGQRSTAAAVARLDPIRPGAVVADASAEVDRLKTPIGMGSLHAGLALVAASGVDRVATGDGYRRAPEGSNLVAFRLDDWPCAQKPCQGWRTLDPYLEVDGARSALPTRGDTFVVVVPPGGGDIAVGIDADGYTQSVSVSDRGAGEQNIALLERRERDQKIPLPLSFRLQERTSIPLDDGTGQVSDVFYRDVVVEYVQRAFFLNGLTPSSPRRALVAINAYYSYAGKTQKAVFGPGEAFFVAPDGTRYGARDLDPSPSTALLGFEIPASVDTGTLLLGGSNERVSTTGQPYTATLAEQRIPISLEQAR